MMRWNVLNLLAEAFDYQSYLEVGLQYGQTFNRVSCSRKVSVDCVAEYNPTFLMPSDEFFRQNAEKFDLIFIDGLHEEEQVSRDAHNALRALKQGGSVVLHDVNPQEQLYQADHCHGGSEPWCGTVWKSWVRMKQELPCEMFVVDTDYGCGVIFPNISTKAHFSTALPITWKALVEHRREWLNLVSRAQFRDWVNERMSRS